MKFAGLAADYSNYAALYACAGITGMGRVQVAWIMSRKRTLDQASLDLAVKAFSDQSLMTGSNPNPVSQEKCPN